MLILEKGATEMPIGLKGEQIIHHKQTVRNYLAKRMVLLAQLVNIDALRFDGASANTFMRPSLLSENQVQLGLCQFSLDLRKFAAIRKG